MSPKSAGNGCAAAEQLAGYALSTLPAGEAAAVAGHVATCPDCREALSRLQPVLDALVEWPTDVLRPAAPLWERLSQRIDPAITGEPARAAAPSHWREPDWEEVAPGITCKLLATDEERSRVSMLVRLAPGIAYPPHRHAGVEELHLLDGELMIGERKLYPGDFNLGQPGELDSFVYSETGCTCVLITSTRDEIC